MPDAAEVSVPVAVVKLPAEFHGPIDYSDRWILLAVLALFLCAVYVAAVLWFTRERPAPPPPPPPPEPDVRAEHLARIEEIAAAVHEGSTSLRDGHQQLSAAVRSYVERITPLPASRMSLADFRARSPRLAEVIEAMYPPEFAPARPGQADREAEEAASFDHALQQARGLVSTWRR